jgi:hypothetical protein
VGAVGGQHLWRGAAIPEDDGAAYLDQHRHHKQAYGVDSDGGVSTGLTPRARLLGVRETSLVLAVRLCSWAADLTGGARSGPNRYSTLPMRRNGAAR